MRGIVTGAICIVMKVNYTHRSINLERVHATRFLHHGCLLPLSIEIHGSVALVPRHFRSNWRARTRHARSTSRFISINGVEPLDRSVELSLSSSNFSRFEQVYKRGTKFPNPRDSARKLENLFPPLCCLNDYLAFVALDYDKFTRRGRKMRRRFNLESIDLSEREKELPSTMRLNLTIIYF